MVVNIMVRIGDYYDIVIRIGLVIQILDVQQPAMSSYSLAQQSHESLVDNLLLHVHQQKLNIWQFLMLPERLFGLTVYMPNLP